MQAGVQAGIQSAGIQAGIQAGIPAVCGDGRAPARQAWASRPGPLNLKEDKHKPKAKGWLAYCSGWSASTRTWGCSSSNSQQGFRTSWHMPPSLYMWQGSTRGRGGRSFLKRAAAHPGEKWGDLNMPLWALAFCNVQVKEHCDLCMNVRWTMIAQTSRVSSIGGDGGEATPPPPNTPASPPNFSVIANLKIITWFLPCGKLLGILQWSFLAMVSMECTTSSNLWMWKVGIFANVGVVWATGSLCSPIASPPN